MAWYKVRRVVKRRFNGQNIFEYIKRIKEV